MKQLSLTLLVLLVNAMSYAQTYTLWSVGDTIDLVTQPKPATLLMGGATEDDRAMKRFLQYANGGDVVVIRTSGADGYNNYMYSQLGVNVHSVRTFLIPSIAAANDSFVVQTVRKAEALWIAGGDQWTYISNWKNTALENALNYLVNVKKAPIGGTSAGMAVMGEYYNSAQGGSAVSATVLNNPYDATVTIGNSDFIQNSFMNDIITDTHFDNPDRKGRLMTFMARTWKDQNQKISGIACQEYTSVFIDTNFKATVYGGQPTFDDNAYFVKIDCEGNNSIEQCISGSPLNWKQDSSVVKVYKMPADTTGTRYFDLRNFSGNANYPNNGGQWEDWWVSNGQFNSRAGSTLNCMPNLVEDNPYESSRYLVYPNPSMNGIFTIQSNHNNTSFTYRLFNVIGQVVPIQKVESNANFSRFQLLNLASGIYFLQLSDEKGKTQLKIKVD
jgi:cyanophycinase-like exopeptidase